jgi:folate-binding protein YgfZ
VARLGVDFQLDQALIQEVDLVELVSFTKGCYLGQETVTRLAHRGHANRVLRGLRSLPPSQAKSPIEFGGAVVGELTTTATSDKLGRIGLALVRREVAPGARVETSGGSATVVALPIEST